MKDWQKLDQPHCVYRIYDAADQLLYVGCSMRPFARHEVLSYQPWYEAAATIKLAWHPTWHHGRVAEMEAINTEHPLHNCLVHEPAHVGMNSATAALGRRKRGDGKHCPKCGNEKENRTMPYCRDCTTAYQQERRRLAKESLARALAKV